MLDHFSVRRHLQEILDLFISPTGKDHVVIAVQMSLIFSTIRHLYRSAHTSVFMYASLDKVFKHDAILKGKYRTLSLQIQNLNPETRIRIILI